MKKLILIISLLGLFVGLWAQSETVVIKDSWTKYTGKTADTVDATGALYKVLKLNNVDYWYNLKITEDIDTLDGCASNLYCILYGSNSGVITDTTRIGSIVTFKGSADTVFTVSNSTLSTNAESIAQHTRTIATYTIHDTTATYNMFISDSTFQTETVAGEDTITVASIALARTVPVQTQTVAAQTITNTITAAGLNWKYLIVYLVGKGASARYELEALYISITKIPGYF